MAHRRKLSRQQPPLACALKDQKGELFVIAAMHGFEENDLIYYSNSGKDINRNSIFDPDLCGRSH